MERPFPLLEIPAGDVLIIASDDLRTFNSFVFFFRRRCTLDIFGAFQTLSYPSCLRVLSQERLQADEVIQALDTQSVWGQGLSINPKDEL